jgi:hypothetical protein
MARRLTAFNLCMKRHLKGGRGGTAAFKAAAKACKKSRR